MLNNGQPFMTITAKVYGKLHSDWRSQLMHDQREPGRVGILCHGIGFLSMSERLLHMVYLSTWKLAFLFIKQLRCLALPRLGVGVASQTNNGHVLLLKSRGLSHMSWAHAEESLLRR
jgi:hypothetical protein